MKLLDGDAVVKTMVAYAYDVDYDHSIYLHMKTFSRDVGLTLPDTGLKTSGELVDFMHKASDKLEMSMLFHYKNYITSEKS